MIRMVLALTFFLFSSLSFGAISELDKALVTRHIEMLLNPGFESGRANWTASGGSLATVTSGSNLLQGTTSVTWDSNAAAQTLCSSSFTIPEGAKGRPGVGSIVMEVPSGTSTHTVEARDGSGNILATSGSRSYAGGANAAQRVNTGIFVFPSSGSIRLCVVAVNSNEPLVALDGATLRTDPWELIASDTSSAVFSYTPTFQNIGTVTSPSFFYQRLGGWMHVWGTGVSGSITAALWSMSLPSGYPINTSVNPINNTTAAAGHQLGQIKVSGGASQNGTIVTATGTSTTLVYLGPTEGGSSNLVPANANIIFGASQTFSLDFYYPIAGYSYETVLKPDQTNFGWINYGANSITATTTNPTKGTIVVDRFWGKRSGDSLIGRIEYKQSSAGTAGSGNYLFGVPTETGCTIDTNKVSAYSTVSSLATTNNVGAFWASDNSTGASGAVSVYDSTKLRLIGLDAGSYYTIGSTAYSLGATTESYTAFFVLPCSGWTENQNAPQLINSFITGYDGVGKGIFADINCDASSSITSQSSGVSSVGNRSSTSCALTLTSGFFSTSPWSCSVTVKAATTQSTSCSCSSATSCTIYGPSADYDAYVSIVGPR